MARFHQIDYEKARKQSYTDIMQERGVKACFFTVLIVTAMFLINEYLLKTPSDVPTYFLMYLVLTSYETFKPKVVIKIRDTLNIPDPKQ